MHCSIPASLESELRSVSGWDAAEDGSGDVEECEVEVQIGADVHRHHSVESAEERGRLRVHQDDAHLFNRRMGCENVFFSHSVHLLY